MRPPSLDECVAYGSELALPEAQCAQFHDYHTSKGWLVGKAPMKSWQAAMRTWKRNYDEGLFRPAGQTDTPAKRQQRLDRTDAEVARDREARRREQQERAETEAQVAAVAALDDATINQWREQVLGEMDEAGRRVHEGMDPRRAPMAVLIHAAMQKGGG